jgi:hypothetical protein
LGSARLSPEAKLIYDQYSLLSEFGIKPWEISGKIYKEDLTYMLACAAFRHEAELKWEGHGNKS